MTQTTVEQSECTALLVTFSVYDSNFGLDASLVQEVIRLGAVTPVRYAPSEVVGVINLRGKIVTLLDTGLILGLGPASRDHESRVFLIEDKGEYLGLLVDRVTDVIEMERGSEGPLPLNVPVTQAQFLMGVCRQAGRVITIIHTARVLAGGRA